MAVLRTLLGDALREARLRQNRTLREGSSRARVSLGYLSAAERAQKEASSGLLASFCRALGVRLPHRRHTATHSPVSSPAPSMRPPRARTTDVCGRRNARIWPPA